jgi:hypothetical protein
MTRDGRDLRRSFQVIERVVALVIDPFPWHEVEDFALALAAAGLRLLPAGLPKDKERDQWDASYDFEVMRKRAQNRSNYEMEVLEEVALCQDTEVPTVVDGRLEPRINSNKELQKCPIVGVIKQQRKGYLNPAAGGFYYKLQPAERTPAFLIQGPSKKETIPGSPPGPTERAVAFVKDTRKKTVPVVSWYLKLDGVRGPCPTGASCVSRSRRRTSSGSARTSATSTASRMPSTRCAAGWPPTGAGRCRWSRSSGPRRACGPSSRRHRGWPSTSTG